LDLIKPFLMQMKAVDDLVKSLPALAIERAAGLPYY
jgi:hypothetical protein